MPNEKTPVVWDDTTNKHRPLGTGEKMGGLDASSILSSDSGNLIQTGSDGLAYLSGGSIADPRADNLLEESANGKLQVTADRIVEWLGLNPSDAEKIAEALAAKMAAELADGKTIVAGGGKLTSDPTNATPAQKKKINQALADADSGLVVDNSTGKLKVDFSNMPTDKFEELLKGLKMKVPLSANMDIFVSVNDANAGDDLIDGRGTQAKPFRHIQAAVDYATSTYSVGNYTLRIRIVAGTYPENVMLPDYDRGTGAILLVPASGARDVIVEAQPESHGGKGVCFNAVGGAWRLYYMDARRTESATLAVSFTGGCYFATGNSTQLSLIGCAASQTVPSGTLGGNDFGVRVFYSDGGALLQFGQGSIAGSVTTSQPEDGNGDPTARPLVDVLYVSRGGRILFVGDSNDATSNVIDCYGSCNRFIYLMQNGSVNTGGTGPIVHFVDHGVTGVPYMVTRGSFVSGCGAPSANFFPGDNTTDAVIDSATYCWYA